MRKRVRSALLGSRKSLLTIGSELDARLLEMYKDRSLQPHDPAGRFTNRWSVLEARLT